MIICENDFKCRYDHMIDTYSDFSYMWGMFYDHRVNSQVAKAFPSLKWSMFYILPEERRLRLRFGPVSDGTASDAPAFPIFPLSLHFLTLSIFTQSYILKVEVQEVQTQIYYSPTLQRVGILMLFSGKIKVEGTTQDVALLERANYFATIKKNSLIIMCSTIPPSMPMPPPSNSLPPDTWKTIDNFFSPNITFLLKAKHFHLLFKFFSWQQLVFVMSWA